MKLEQRALENCRKFFRYLLVVIAIAITQSVLAQPPDESARRFHVLPLVADGDGFQSSLLMTNVADTANQCALNLQGPGLDSGRFEANDNVSWSGSDATIDFVDSGAQISITSAASQSLTFGYATLDCVEPVVARIFFVVNAAEAVAGMTTIPNAQVAAEFKFPVLPRFGVLALIFSNHSNLDAACSIELDDDFGTTVDDESFQVPASSTAVHFLNDVVQAPADFSGGSATVTCDQQISATGLIVNGAVVAALPPAILSILPAMVSPPEPPPDPVVSVTAGSAVTEGAGASFTITADIAPGEDLPLNVSVAQEGAFAGAGDLGTKTITLSAGQTSVRYIVPTVDDDVDEANGALTVTIDSGNGYMVSTNAGSARVAISDNDEPETPVSDTVEILDGLRVSDGRIQFGFLSAGNCISISNTTFNGVTYTIHSSKWQRRSDANSPWEDIPGTDEQGAVCSLSPTDPGEYRVIMDISIGGNRGMYTSENTIVVQG